jgi:predicted dehydrogenase
MTVTTKRIAPGHNNTWFTRVYGTRTSVEYSTKNPKEIRVLPYTPGGAQAWHVSDVACESAYKSITGGIFEFGFSDAILQMWAAFCDEIVHGREGMRQPLYCATPQEALAHHEIFTAALESQRGGTVARLK